MINGSDKTKRKYSYLFLVLLFVLPAFFFYGLFNLVGIVRTFYYSTLSWRGISAVKEFIGLANYRELFTDLLFWKSLRNNLILVLVSVGIQIPLALGLALLINTKRKGVRFFRTVFFMPMLLSTVATGIMWLLFYDPYYGLLSYMIKALHLGKPVALLQGSTALPAILFVICWQYIPFYMIILKAGLTGIPSELYEAARMDGATEWDCFRYITMPLILPTIRSSAVLQIVGSLKYFDLFYVMMGGAPNQHTELMATYMFKKGFTEFRMGYASAVSASMFLICFIFACAFLFATNRKEEA